MADVGTGGTLAFTTQGGSYSIISIAGHEESRGIVDSTHLGTTGQKTSFPTDLEELATFTVSIQFLGTAGLPAFMSVAETVTVTHPLLAGDTTAANIAGTAYVTRRKFPDLAVGELMVGEVDVVFDGGTGPTWTAAT